ncbi:unnamed protein product, partial [marine sediment metagenome]
MLKKVEWPELPVKKPGDLDEGEESRDVLDYSLLEMTMLEG